MYILILINKSSECLINFDMCELHLAVISLNFYNF